MGEISGRLCVRVGAALFDRVRERWHFYNGGIWLEGSRIIFARIDLGKLGWLACLA